MEFRNLIFQRSTILKVSQMHGRNPQSDCFFRVSTYDKTYFPHGKAVSTRVCENKCSTATRCLPSHASFCFIIFTGDASYLTRGTIYEEFSLPSRDTGAFIRCQIKFARVFLACSLTKIQSSVQVRNACYFAIAAR